MHISLITEGNELFEILPWWRSIIKISYTPFRGTTTSRLSFACGAGFIRLVCCLQAYGKAARLASLVEHGFEAAEKTVLEVTSYSFRLLHAESFVCYHTNRLASLLKQCGLPSVKIKAVFASRRKLVGASALVYCKCTELYKIPQMLLKLTDDSSL